MVYLCRFLSAITSLVIRLLSLFWDRKWRRDTFTGGIYVLLSDRWGEGRELILGLLFLNCLWLKIIRMSKWQFGMSFSEDFHMPFENALVLPKCVQLFTKDLCSVMACWVGDPRYGHCTAWCIICDIHSKTKKWNLLVQKSRRTYCY